MPTDIREFYRVLELSPGATLEEIKGSYRRLLQQWHPDRYKAGSLMQTTAEDVTKELNEAYNQLARKKRFLEFRPKRPARAPVETTAPGREPWAPHRAAKKAYAEAGVAPPENPRPRPPPPAAPQPHRNAPRREPPTPPRANAVREPAPVKPVAPRRRRSWRGLRWTLAWAALLALGVLVWRTWPDSTESPSPQRSVARRGTPVTEVAPMAPAVASGSGRVAATTEPAAAPGPGTRPERTPVPVVTPATELIPVVRGREFTPPLPTSSTMPTFAPPHASLRAASFDPLVQSPLAPRAFAPGSATPTWTASRALNPTSAVDHALSLLDTFGPGATKARVIEVQGPPDDTGDGVFRYGSSLVFFAEGRVTHWSDGWPRLRVFVLPRFTFGGLASFGVGSTRSEVVRAQGLPAQVTSTVYYYGASAVYFHRDWVVGWSEVDQPLRTRPGL